MIGILRYSGCRLEVDGAGNCWKTSNIVVNAPYLAAADSVLKWCEENHIYVLFDGWHESGQGNTVGNFSPRRSSLEHHGQSVQKPGPYYVGDIQ